MTIGSVFKITADNTSANDATISSLKRKLSRNKNALILAAYMHFRYATYILTSKSEENSQNIRKLGS